MLVFNAETHTYRLDGVVLPSVTTVISPLIDYSMVKPEVLERARQKGTAVHRMVALDCADDLDEESLSDELKPFLVAWRAFRKHTGFEPLTSEKQMAHPLMMFAGTSDLTGIISGRHSVVDVKTMLVLGPVTGIQLAAYKTLHNLEGVEILDRYALGLRATGGYKVVPYLDPYDWNVFVALLTLYNWKTRHGTHRQLEA